MTIRPNNFELSDKEFFLRWERILEEKGIEVSISSAGNGSVGILFSKLPLLLQDPDLFFAEIYGISLERFKAFKSFDGRCRGITKKGTRCQNWAPGEHDPADFVPGISDRCIWHIDHPSYSAPARRWNNKFKNVSRETMEIK